MKVIFKIMQKKVKEYIIGIMVINMMVNGKTISEKEEEQCITMMEKLKKVIGKMTSFKKNGFLIFGSLSSLLIIN